MTTASEILRDGLDRVRENVEAVLDGLTPAQLAARLDPDANPIGWLVWHLTRVADDHVADVAGGEQLWTSAGWVERFRLPYDVTAIGFGHTSEEVAQLHANAELLAGYHDAVHRACSDYLGTLAEDDLDRVVDERWDPPVTLGARLVSVVNDTAQHVGQAAFVRGVLERTGRGVGEPG